MSLSRSTLSAIQKAGAAVFSANEMLKKSVKDYAERVSAAVAANPFDLANDSLMEDWRTAARLSQTFAGIEAEIQKVFHIAAELSGDGQPSGAQSSVLTVPARAVRKGVRKQNSATVKTAKTAKTAVKNTRQISKAVKSAPVAPTRSTEPSVAAPRNLAPTEVLMKSRKKTPHSKTSASQSAPSSIVAAATKTGKAAKPVKVAKAAKVASSATGSPAPGGNPAKLLAHLASLLNSSDFTTFSQTAASRETGIPLGSMTAATKKLLQMGRIMAGPAGSFKLADVPQPVAP